MVGLIVAGHVCYALGMRSAVEAVVGRLRSVRYIDFTSSLSAQELQDKMSDAIAAVDKGAGVLVLTDLPGGTPCNKAVAAMMQTTELKVISGANVSMIVTACNERKNQSLNQLTELVIRSGQAAIKDMDLELGQLASATPSIADAL